MCHHINTKISYSANTLNSVRQVSCVRLSNGYFCRFILELFYKLNPSTIILHLAHSLHCLQSHFSHITHSHTFIYLTSHFWANFIRYVRRALIRCVTAHSPSSLILLLHHPSDWVQLLFTVGLPICGIQFWYITYKLGKVHDSHPQHVFLSPPSSLPSSRFGWLYMPYHSWPFESRHDFMDPNSFSSIVIHLVVSLPTTPISVCFISIGSSHYILS